MIMIKKLTLVALFFGISTAAIADLSQLPEKAPTDRSAYRHLFLDNGLRVILLSDPDLNKSSAAMAVAVGSLGDPENREGLAHFLEHILSRGSKKFPDETEQWNYIASNGGFRNAYTSGDHTNYLFEVNHDAFDGALDRFADMFVAPILSASMIEREVNAVDSEFENNIKNDGWRGQQMFRHLVREDHPEHHFSIGNLDTLSGIERPEFVAFFDRYYSANQMALSLVSNASLDQLEDWARKYFSAIENKERPDVDYGAELIDSERLPGLTLFEPIADRRSLELTFPTQATRDLYRSKPASLISFLLGYEGAGSLLSMLKEAGLATALGSSAYEATKDYSLFNINVELTESGAENWQQVMRSTFAYLELLRNTDFPEYLFDERAVVARLQELYSDKGEGAWRASDLSADALHYPLEDAARVRYIWEEPSPDNYFELLDALRPNNMIAALEMKGVPVEQEEPYFGIQYSFQPFTPELLASLEQPAPIAALSLPAPNQYLPEQVDLLAERPVKLIEEPGLNLYYAQDEIFERPRVSYAIRIRLPEKLSEIGAVVRRDFYVEALNDMLNEQLYTASVAGLQARIYDSARGIRISASGYSQPMSQFLESLLAQVKTLELSPERFQALKDRKLRDWKNAEFRSAYQQAYEFEASYLYEKFYTSAEKLAAAEDLTLEDVQRFASSLFRRGNVEVVAYGNVSQQEAARIARQAVSSLDLSAVASRNVYETRMLELADGESVLAADSLVINNSAYLQGYLLGKATPENRAAAQMLDNFLREPYFSELRTRQQLGYVVSSGASEQEDNIYIRFLLQSADYTADELQRRSEEFIAGLPLLFDALPDAKLEAIRSGVRAELEEKDKSIAERANRFFDLAFNEDGDWNRTADTMAALEQISRDTLRAMLQALSNGEISKVTTLVMAEQHTQALDNVQPTFGDVGAWKEARRYR